MLKSVALHSTQINDQYAWELLFESLLGTEYLSENPVIIAVDKEQVKIETNDPNLQYFLLNILGHPNNMRAALAYTLEHKSTTKPLDIPINVLPNISTENLNSTIKKLFDENILDEMHTCFQKGTDDQIKQRYEKVIPTTDRMRKLYEAHLNVLHGALSVPLKTLQAAYLSHRIFLNDPDAKSPQMERFLKDIAGIDKNKFYFNYGFLLQLICPPIPHVAITSDAIPSYTITYPRGALNNYLASVINEGFLLHMKSDSQAQTIFLAPKKPVKPDNLYLLILDCSSSMQDNFENYIYQIKQFIDNLLAIAGTGDTIRLVSFSEPPNKVKVKNNIKTKDFELHMNDVQFKIHQHLDTLFAGGGTRLHGTINDELDNLTNYPDKDTAVLIFTDGCDNLSSDYEKSELYKKTASFSQMSSPPKIWSLGLGNSLNEDLMKGLANNTGSDYIHLTSIEEFECINAQIGKMQIPRILMHFMQESISTCTPVYQGHLALGPMLNPSKPFKVDGKEHQAHPQIRRVIKHFSTFGTSFSVIPDRKLESSEQSLSHDTTTVITTSTPMLTTSFDSMNQTPAKRLAHSKSEEDLSSLVKLKEESKQKYRF